MEVEDTEADGHMVSFHSVKVDGIQKGGVQLNATQVQTVYATSPPMMTMINVGEVGMARFECDTAASHNIMSQELYNKLRSRKPDRIPKLKQEKLAIHLADGSISSKIGGTGKEHQGYQIGFLCDEWAKQPVRTPSSGEDVAYSV